MIFTLGEKYAKTFIVSENVHEQFIELFKDKNPLHTNELFAISKGFKGKVMHGNILNGYLSYFVGEVLPIKDVIIHLQEIQYKNPVYLNDELQFFAEVSDVYESVSTIVFKFNFKNKDLKVVAKGKIQIGII